MNFIVIELSMIRSRSDNHNYSNVPPTIKRGLTRISKMNICEIEFNAIMPRYYEANNEK